MALRTICCCLLTQSCPLSVAREAPLSMGFSRQEYWIGSPFPSPGDHPNPGIEPTFSVLAGGFFMTEPPGKPTWGLLIFSIGRFSSNAQIPLEAKLGSSNILVLSDNHLISSQYQLLYFLFAVFKLTNFNCRFLSFKHRIDLSTFWCYNLQVMLESSSPSHLFICFTYFMLYNSHSNTWYVA